MTTGNTIRHAAATAATAADTTTTAAGAITHATGCSDATGITTDTTSGTPGADAVATPFRLRALAPFLAIAFGLAWGILALFILLPQVMTPIFGQLHGNHPLFFLAVWAPGIAALVLVAARTGMGGLRRFGGRALRWRCPAGWAAFLVLGLPGVFYVGAALNGELVRDAFPLPTAGAIPAALLLAAIKGPLEEFGWRGFALPLLQRRLAPLAAALLLGLVWGLWHLPAFLLSGTQQSSWAFGPFLAGCLAISVIATGLFNASRGSILLAAVLHFQLMNPIWPDAQPYDTVVLLAVAVVVVWQQRRTMLRRGGGVTEIVPAGR